LAAALDLDARQRHQLGEDGRAWALAQGGIDRCVTSLRRLWQTPSGQSTGNCQTRLYHQNSRAKAIRCKVINGIGSDESQA
jgi:hypothetical protein